MSNISMSDDDRWRLTVDHGNSRTKLALWHEGELHPRREMALRTVCGTDIEAMCSGHRPSCAAYCSVVDFDGDMRDMIAAACDDMIILDPATTPTPLRVGYDTPQTLGADRLAAAVGAYHLTKGETLVVDLGTAITYDFISDDGVFVGGNIAPGIAMRLRALNAYTARLPLVDPCGTVETWGRDTASALRSGAVDGVVGEIEYYRSRLATDAAVILTGGGATIVAERLSFVPMVTPDLVSLGLNTIIDYNKTL